MEEIHVTIILSWPHVKFLMKWRNHIVEKTVPQDGAAPAVEQFLVDLFRSATNNLIEQKKRSIS